MTRILVDENIIGAEALLAPLGEVVRFHGRSLTSADLAGAHALLVRSVTRVDAQLLAGSEVRFVGSTTIGTDHLDIDYLESAGISWCNAPGSNANSVVDYCLSAFCRVPDLLEGLLSGRRVGIVGYGNVGARLHRRLAALGVDCVAYDPLLNTQQCPVQGSLREVLSCPVVSVHTPLTRQGRFPTWHMLELSALSGLPQGAVLLNAGRGEVVATQALLALQQQRPDIRLVLDVWENEPEIDQTLLAEAYLATPHIAGYSQDGKWQGLLQVGRALARSLGQELIEPLADSLLAEPVEVDVSGCESVADAVRAVTLASYDIVRDSDLLKAARRENSMGVVFDRLRREYPARREIASARIRGQDQLSQRSRVALAALGPFPGIV